MSADPSVDRESFQQFLASAFAVQESHIDSRFLSAFLGLQQSVAGGELDIDSVMSLVVASARDVADAAGVAIGLLEGDQLVYRAGSGCSALWIGARFAASLTVSSKAKGSREILRVENAHTDTRIEGAICRQFGAESLLILPIYRDRLLAGVIEILFSEPHDYQDCEVRMYQLMAGLIEQAMCRPVQPELNLPAELPAARNAFEEAPRSPEHSIEERSFLHSTGKNNIFRRCGAALAAAAHSPALRQPRLRADIMVRRAMEIFANKPLRSLALSAVVTGLGLTFWMAHDGRGSASSWESSARSKSTVVRSLQPEVKPVDVTSKGRSEPISANEARRTKLRNRRVRVGQTAVDYIGDDVTVRHLTRTPARQRPTGQVAHIGEDVTVRYFTPKPAARSQSQ